MTMHGIRAVAIYFGLAAAACALCWWIGGESESMALHVVSSSQQRNSMDENRTDFEFVVQNVTGEPVRIDRMIPDCTCIGTDRKLPRLVSSRETTNFTLAVLTTGKTGDFPIRVECYSGRFLVCVLQGTVKLAA